MSNKPAKLRGLEQFAKREASFEADIYFSF
jgi:hypothetical protein